VFNCVSSVVDEIIIVDTGSTDGTQELCRKLGAYVYQIDGVPGYGPMRTLTAALARTDWVLFLDGDERMLPQDVGKLKSLAQTQYDLIWMPRQHYRAWDMSICENPDIKEYADWQPRFYRNNRKIHFVRKVHENVRGAENPLMDFSNPVIRHFGFLKSDERLKMIKDMCDRLYRSDDEHAESYTIENRLGEAGGSNYWKEVANVG